MRTPPTRIRRTVTLSPLLFAVAAAAIFGGSGCSKTITGATPTVTSVTPTLACNQQLTTSIAVAGDGLSPLPTRTLTSSPQLVLPVLALTRSQDINGAAVSGAPVPIPDDPAAPASSHVRWMSEQAMSFDVYPELALATGLYDLTATNGDGKEATSSGALTIVPPPVLDSIEPELVCSEAMNGLTLRGDFFLEVGTALPSVSFTPMGGGAPVALAATALSDCRTLPGPAQAQACKTLTLLLAPKALAAARYDVVVTNPAPAGCSSTQAVPFFVLPRPTLTEVKAAEICTAQFDNVVTLTGTGFLVIGGVLPTVTVGTKTFTPTAVPASCTPYDGPKTAVQVCTQLTIGVKKDDLPVGVYDVVVTNPAPAGCATTEPVKLEVAPPPGIDAVVPAKICEGGGDIVITGSGFRTGATVTAGGVMASAAVSADGKTITATFGFGLSAGTYSLVVSNPDGCKATAATSLLVVPGPIIFSVDPPVVWNGITTQVTVWGTPLDVAPTKVSIQPAGMPAARMDLTFAYDPSKPHRVQVDVPKGLPAGLYDVIVHDPSGCDASLAMGLKVVDKTDLSITKVEPPFGDTAVDTAVTIFADDAVGGGLKAIPRAYLNPSTPGPGTKATALRGIGFIDSKRMTAVVPKGLPAGAYDVVVVNPDGGVGTKTMAFKVTTAPPPVIDSISPGSITTSSTGAVSLAGSGFRAGATVSLSCSTPGSAAAPTPYSAGVGTNTASAMDITVPASTIAAGSACVIRVTNTDGTYGEFSALGVTNPAANLGAFGKGTDMNVARRALTSVAGRVSSAARFLYAIGGDSGAASGALDSVELAPVDSFGAMGGWIVNREKLPTKLTLAGSAILGRLIYVVGGSTGSASSGKTYRAEILDTAKVPGFADLDVVKNGINGLGKGTWVYRIAAVMGAGDATNPGGETLPSEPITVQLPDLGADKLKVTVTWTAVAGAASYRVYRSTAADKPLGSELLLGEVATLSFGDVGAAPAGTSWLPVGSTGTWTDIGKALGTPRAGLGVTLAPDPVTAGKFYVYAVGGSNGGTDQSSIEVLPITMTGPVAQTLGSWGPAGAALGTARAQLGVAVATHAVDPQVSAGTVYLYAGPGAASASIVEAFTVTTGTGALAARVKLSKDFANDGYGFFAVNDFVFALGGGSMATPSATGLSGQICMNGGGMGCTGPPEVRNWNAGQAIDRGRYLMGTALESAFIFVVGGAADGPLEAASKSTSLTIW